MFSSRRCYIASTEHREDLRSERQFIFLLKAATQHKRDYLSFASLWRHHELATANLFQLQLAGLEGCKWGCADSCLPWKATHRSSSLVAVAVLVRSKIQLSCDVSGDLKKSADPDHNGNFDNRQKFVLKACYTCKSMKAESLDAERLESLIALLRQAEKGGALAANFDVDVGHRKRRELPRKLRTTGSVGSLAIRIHHLVATAGDSSSQSQCTKQQLESNSCADKPANDTDSAEAVPEQSLYECLRQTSSKHAARLAKAARSSPRAIKLQHATTAVLQSTAAQSWQHAAEWQQLPLLLPHAPVSTAQDFSALQKQSQAAQQQLQQEALAAVTAQSELRAAQAQEVAAALQLLPLNFLRSKGLLSAANERACRTLQRRAECTYVSATSAALARWRVTCAAQKRVTAAALVLTAAARGYLGRCSARAVRAAAATAAAAASARWHSAQQLQLHSAARVIARCLPLLRQRRAQAAALLASRRQAAARVIARAWKYSHERSIGSALADVAHAQWRIRCAGVLQVRLMFAIRYGAAVRCR
jgi:hypothetical protein